MNLADPGCTWQGTDNWGFVKNARALWDKNTVGAYLCTASLPALNVHPDAKFYYPNPPAAADAGNDERRVKVLHLIRQMYACHASGLGGCAYSKANIDVLAANLVSGELAKQRAEVKNASGFFPSWHYGYNATFFDLGALPEFRFWAQLVDLFYNTPSILSVADRDYITAELGNEIDSYIAAADLTQTNSFHWAVHNGNNWTTVLNAAAMYWVVAYWHEQNTKARRVLQYILETNWLHRPFFLSDGSYIEGPSYFEVTLDGLSDMNELQKGSFNEPIHAMPWYHMSTKTTQWLLDNVASDSRFLDFGDAWAKDGFGMMYYISLSAWEEWVGTRAEGTTTFNACNIRAFFANQYFDYHFRNPYKPTGTLMRDWSSIVASCVPPAGAALAMTTYPEYQTATLRSTIPGATNLAATAGTNMKYLQADQTMLASNGVDNSLPHREVDFGAVIWSAFGNRLLFDWGYGELSSTYDFFRISGNKGRFVKTSNSDTIEFYIKKIDSSKTIDTTKLRIGLTLNYSQKDIALSPYVTNVSTSWTKVVVPLIDFGFAESSWTAVRTGGDPGAPWTTPGLEHVYFRTNGATANPGTNIGIDEIKLVDATTPANSVYWYGESHRTVTDPRARADAGTAFYLASEEVSGGANSTASWMNLFVSNSGKIFRMYYSGDPDEFILANQMDYLPVGANTLVIPGARENGDLMSNMSQFKGEKGQMAEITVGPFSGFVMDASAVYGSARADGNLEYFLRYGLGMGNGDYLLVDTFKAKAGKEDKIQEFWYTHADPNFTACSPTSYNFNVVMTQPSANTLQLVPSCNGMNRSVAAESAGRIIAAAAQPGSMVLGAPSFLTADPLFNRYLMDGGKIIRLLNRVNSWDYRRIARYEPSAAVSEDVRVFLMQSAAGVSKFTAASVTKKASCASPSATAICFTVIDGAMNVEVRTDKVDGRYQVVGIQ